MPARQVEPPTAVLGFAYNMTPAAAEQACSARQQSWQLKGSMGTCAPGAKPDAKLVRLEFQSGAIDKIAVIHAAAPDQLPTVYEQLLRASWHLWRAAARPGSVQRSMQQVARRLHEER